MIRIRYHKGKPETAKADALAVLVAQGVRTPLGLNAKSALSREIASFMKSEVFNGKKGTLSVLIPRTRLSQRKVILLGIGKRDDLGRDGIRDAFGTAARRLGTERVGSVAFVLPRDGNGNNAFEDLACAAVEGLALGSYRFDTYKTGNSRTTILREATITGVDGTGLKAAIRRSLIACDATCWARDLVNRCIWACRRINDFQVVSNQRDRTSSSSSHRIPRT